MNINLSPAQFLTVYNCLSDLKTLEAQEIKNKMNAVLVDALSSIDDVDSHNKFNHWFKKEKEKVNTLQEQLNTIDDGIYPRPEV